MKISIKILIVTFFLIIPLSVSAKTFDNNLYFGITNNSDVQMLQEFLTDQGVYSGPITGNFFSLTLAAVKKYQIQNNITPTAGFFGPITRTKANEILLVQLNASNQQSVAETGTVAPATIQNSHCLLPFSTCKATRKSSFSRPKVTFTPYRLKQHHSTLLSPYIPTLAFHL